MVTQVQGRHQETLIRAEDTELKEIPQELIGRIERLEKLCEKLYHETEIVDIYTEKLVNILLEYFPKGEHYRKELESKIITLRSLLQLHEHDVQGLKKGYHTHSDRTKRKDTI